MTRLSDFLRQSARAAAIVDDAERRLYAEGARRIAHDEWAMPAPTMGRPVRKRPALAAPYAYPQDLPESASAKRVRALVDVYRTAFPGLAAEWADVLARGCEYARPRGMPAATAFKVAGALAKQGVRVKLHKPAGGSGWLVTPCQ